MTRTLSAFSVMSDARDTMEPVHIVRSILEEDIIRLIYNNSASNELLVTLTWFSMNVDPYGRLMGKI